MPSEGFITRSMVFKELISPCLVDLIDMQSNADCDFRFILNYQDNRTKFVFLRPLKTIRTKDVARTLLDVFTIITARTLLDIL